MNIAVVDIECNGLDTETVDIHCIVIDVPGSSDAGDIWTYENDGQGSTIASGIAHLNDLIASGYALAGHNVIEYDFPILRRFGMAEPPLILDTLVISRAVYPSSELYKRDHITFNRRPELRDEIKAGAHSLKAWGLRLGCPKDEYTGGWDAFNQEMLDYCVQDVKSNVQLLHFLLERLPIPAAKLECDVAQVCRDMRLHGVAFDVAKAEQLTVRLAERRGELTSSLREAFGGWWAPGDIKTPKRSQCSRKADPGTPGYRNVREGCPAQDVVWTEFNPASADHVALALTRKYGWKPRVMTDGGKPSTKADVLRDLPYPEAADLAEFQEIKKILGFISEGTNAWLKLEKNGRLHGKVNPTGTVSGRAAHSAPNTGQVPSRSALGQECRALFTADHGQVLVGADASGLQLRALAHYLAEWDAGAFARQCEDGDIHEYMRAATGLYKRSFQKTWTYAKIFGAGPPKLGETVIADHYAALQEGLTSDPVPKQSAARRLGQESLFKLGDAIPAFSALEARLKKFAKRGWLVTLDGRRLPISSEHIAIAMLLQGAEACIMKLAMVRARAALDRLGAKYVLWVHDEYQVTCRAEVADEVGRELVSAMTWAGEQFGLAVRIDGDYQIGSTWAETH